MYQSLFSMKSKILLM